MSLEFRIWKQTGLRQLTLGTCIKCVYEELLLCRGGWNNHLEIWKLKPGRVPGRDRQMKELAGHRQRCIKCVSCRGEREAARWRLLCKSCEFQLYGANALKFLASRLILKILYMNTFFYLCDLWKRMFVYQRRYNTCHVTPVDFEG